MIGRRTVLVFALLAAVPTVLAVNSFRPFVPLPMSMQVPFERVFRLTVYYPVAGIRSIVFEPLGLTAIYSIPILQHAIILATLFAFYFAVSVVLVTATTRVRRAVDRVDGR